MNNFVEIAMSLRRLGYSVIPIQPKSKKPIVSWKRFQNKSAGEVEIKAWAKSSPDCGIAIVTGKVSGALVVLDVDPRNGGDKTIEGKHLPPTPTVKTGGGGLHYYYRHDAELPSGPIAPGLDLKAEKGYVVAPPSIHPSGNPYAWADGLTPTDLERAPVPEWILQLVGGVRAVKGRASDSPPQAEPGSPAVVDVSHLEADLSDFEDPPRDEAASAITTVLKPFWREGQRNALNIAVCGLLANSKWQWDDARKVIDLLSEGDEEAESRLATLKETYRKFEKHQKVRGVTGLAELIPAAPLRRVVQLARGENPDASAWVMIRKHRGGKLPAVEKRRRVAVTVRKDLANNHGEFLVTPGPDYYFFESHGRSIFPVDSRDMRALVDEAYSLNSSELETKCVIEHLLSYTHRFGRYTEIYRTCRYDKEAGVLYINLAGGRIARLDGTSIQTVDNGTDGILFMDEVETIEPDLSATVDLRKVLFSGVNFTRQQDRKLQEILCWAWLRLFFFFEILPTRPIFALIGPKGSGKTFLLKVFLRLVYGSLRTEPDSVTKEDAFEASISNNYLLTIDNVDERLPWLNDSLAKAATGQTIRKRRLYTTNDEVQIQPRCFLALSSRTPHFKREDVSDRLLIIRLDRLFEGEFAREAVLLAPVTGPNRDKVWGALLRELNACVQWIKTHPAPEKSKHRLADWEALATVIAEKDGQRELLAKALEAMEEERVSFVLEDDAFVPQITKISDGEWRTAKEIFGLIGEEESGFRNSKALGIHLTNKADTFRAAFGMEMRTDKHLKTHCYRFPQAIETQAPDSNGAQDLSPEMKAAVALVGKHFEIASVRRAGSAEC